MNRLPSSRSEVPGLFPPRFRQAAMLLVLATAALLCLPPARATAQAKVNLVVQDNLFISPAGDARFTRRVPLSKKDYTDVRKANPPVRVLAQTFGFGVPDWLDKEQMRVYWDDAARTIQLRWSVAGLARAGHGPNWEISLQLRNARLLTTSDHTVALTGTGLWRFGEALRTVRVVLPAESRDIRLLSGTDRLAYRLPSPAAQGQNASAEARLEARSHLLGCLTQVYAEPKFGLWAGRLVFKNTGDQALRNYRVRFQVAGFSQDWSPWQTCPQVVPGQTVVNRCFPVFDAERIGQITGVRAAFLKAQYQYRRADGRLVEETESTRLSLLGRNLIEYGSKPFVRGTTFEEGSDLEPFIMTALVTYQDPAIQQLAGRLCHEIGGSAASLREKDALRYMEALYNFMSAHISYQTPPGDVIEGRMRQHVKFGRDVLKNHAGTCIDLAILFASACETVGLEPIMVSIPGHTFSGVRWHDREKKTERTYFVETTLIGRASFAEALKVGAKEFNEMIAKKKPRVITDVKRLRNLGLQSLELPPVADDWLARICPGSGRPLVRPAARNLVGSWRTTYRSGDLTIAQTVTLRSNGTFTTVAVDQRGRRVVLQGTYTYANGVLSANSNRGLMEGTVTWLDENRIRYANEREQMVYTRID